MHTLTYLRRAAAPVALTGLLTASAVLASPASAIDLSPQALAAIAPAAAVAPAGGLAVETVSARTTSAQAASPEPANDRAPRAEADFQRVVAGERLHLKPPPWRLPVDDYRLTAGFGASSGLWSSTHTGLDFAAPEGTELRAVAPGVIDEVGSDGAYGTKTVLRLHDGTVLWYAHQSGVTVEQGQRVAAGEVIGYVGSTGNVTGPHLHLEVRPADDEPVDPDAWLHQHDLDA